MEFSCHFSEPIQYCVSQPSLNTCCTTKHNSLYGGKSQSVCAIITQPQDNFWLQSVVRPPPLIKINAENSQKALEASYV